MNAAGVPQGATLSNPYNNFVGGTPFPYNGSYTDRRRHLRCRSQDFDWSYAYQTNVGVQREIGRRAGRRRGLHRHVQPEPPVRARRELPGGDAHRHHGRRQHPVAPAQPGVRRRCCCSTRISTSNYNGLQLTFTCAGGTTSSFNGFYTLSKTMSSAQLHNNTTQGGAQNYSKLGEDYGRADTDQRHVFSTSVNWEIDYYRRRQRRAGASMLNGWTHRADHQAAQRPAVHHHQRQRRRQPRRQDERPRAAGRRSRTSTTPRRSSGSIPPRSFRTGSSPAWRPTATRRATCSTGPGFRVVDLAVSRDFQLPGRCQADASAPKPPTRSTSSTTASLATASRRARRPRHSA